MQLKYMYYVTQRQRKVYEIEGAHKVMIITCKYIIHCTCMYFTEK